ncbi:MAG: hypothetical protein AB1467_07015 [Candidatus Diapherotrites archaeon]
MNEMDNIKKLERTIETNEKIIEVLERPDIRKQIRKGQFPEELKVFLPIYEKYYKKYHYVTAVAGGIYTVLLVELALHYLARKTKLPPVQRIVTDSALAMGGAKISGYLLKKILKKLEEKKVNKYKFVEQKIRELKIKNERARMQLERMKFHRDLKQRKRINLMELKRIKGKKIHAR